MRFSAQVDTLSLSDSSNKAGKSAEICHSSNVNGNTLSDSNDIVPNKQLQKFVEYVSYLKFLVTFVATDVNIRVDTKDDQDPITAASFEASGRFSKIYTSAISQKQLDFLARLYKWGRGFDFD